MWYKISSNTEQKELLRNIDYQKVNLYKHWKSDIVKLITSNIQASILWPHHECFINNIVLNMINLSRICIKYLAAEYTEVS